MHNCEDISKLISESMDHRLSSRKRMVIKFHLFWCRCPVCQSYSRQMQAFREALKCYRDALVKDTCRASECLSDEDKEAIKIAMKRDD